eukprot:jgi/Chlat1/9036/Chrsp94S08305
MMEVGASGRKQPRRDKQRRCFVCNKWGTNQAYSGTEWKARTEPGTEPLTTCVRCQRPFHVTCFGEDRRMAWVYKRSKTEDKKGFCGECREGRPVPPPEPSHTMARPAAPADSAPESPTGSAPSRQPAEPPKSLAPEDPTHNEDAARSARKIRLMNKLARVHNDFPGSNVLCMWWTIHGTVDERVSPGIAHDPIITDLRKGIVKRAKELYKEAAERKRIQQQIDFVTRAAQQERLRMEQGGAMEVMAMPAVNAVPGDILQAVPVSSHDNSVSGSMTRPQMIGMGHTGLVRLQPDQSSALHEAVHSNNDSHLQSNGEHQL